MKKTNLSFTFLLLSFLCLSSMGRAQSILVSNGPFSGPMSIGSFNLLTCEYTPLFSGLPRFNDFVQMPNGDIYLLGFDGSSAPAILELEPNGNVNVLYSFPSGNAYAMHPVSPTELLVNVGFNDYYLYDITTNTATLLGSSPGLNGLGEFVEINGVIYVNAFTGASSQGLYEVTLNPFSVSTSPSIPAVGQNFPMVGVCDNIFSNSGAVGLVEINPDNGTTNLLCEDFSSSLPPSVGSGDLGFAEAPFNNTGPLCDCISESGTLLPVFYTPCVGETITISHNGDETLDGNDNLAFLLVDGIIYDPFPSDILYSFPTTAISFLPGITEVGEVYTIYAVAADAIADSVDLSDPCREISSNALIQWVEGPTVTFSENNSGCTSGCLDVAAAFTGTPPFELTYELVLSNGTTTTATETFNSLNETFEVCPPPGFEGSISIAATNLEDNFCTCSN